MTLRAMGNLGSICDTSTLAIVTRKASLTDHRQIPAKAEFPAFRFPEYVVKRQCWRPEIAILSRKYVHHIVVNAGVTKVPTQPQRPAPAHPAPQPNQTTPATPTQRFSDWAAI